MKKISLLISCFALLLVSFVGNGCLSSPNDDLPDLYQTLQDNNLFRMVEAIEALDFVTNITGQVLTLMVPTNEAFDEWLSDNGYSAISDVPVDELREVIRYHIQIGLAPQAGHF